MRDLSMDERDVLYKLANWVEEHGDVFAVMNPDHYKPVRTLLRRGYVMTCEFTNGAKGVRLLQSGYDEANRLWDCDTHNNPDAIAIAARNAHTAKGCQS